MAQNNEVNTVTLSKSIYDSMRGTNDRASMLLSRIIGTFSIENDSDVVHLDEKTILSVIEILYPDTYKKKVSALKTLRAKNFLKHANLSDED